MQSLKNISFLYRVLRENNFFFMEFGRAPNKEYS